MQTIFSIYLLAMMPVLVMGIVWSLVEVKEVIEGLRYYWDFYDIAYLFVTVCGVATFAGLLWLFIALYRDCTG